MALNIPCVAVRGSTGISLNQGPPTYDAVSAFTKDDSKSCRTMLFSPQGRYFAWINKTSVKIVSCETWKVVAELAKPKVSSVKFSSQDTYLMTWEPFTVTLGNPQGSPNLHIWKSETGELVKSFVQKKQIDWEPQWTSDENVCAMLINSEVVFYEGADFENIVHRLHGAKVVKFSISPGKAPYHVLCYMPGKPSQPSFVRLFKYPDFKLTQSLASKSFFQADKVDIFWNKKGNSALLMTSTEVDKSGASYYGKQTLYYISTKGETSLVMGSAEGPIHAVEWSPKNTEFCCIYGFMPAKATLFNQKCEAVFEFGLKHRNSIYFNPHGNIVLLAGFGNLNGNIELWDTSNKKLIASSEAADTTLLQWSPDGEHFMTATTAPRLRMANGFKIWHYTGTLLYERPWNVQEELWEVLWQSYPEGMFPKKAISYKAVEGIAPSQPQASKQAYRPPSARAHAITFDLHKNDDAVSKPDAKLPKSVMKQKKKKEAKKARKELEAAQQPSSNNSVNGQSNNVTPKPAGTAAVDPDLTDDPEKNKKIKKIKSKLEQISKLKEQQSSGKQLEMNQLDKIKKEAELTKELQELIL